MKKRCAAAKYAVYELEEFLVCEGDIKEICKFIECDKSAITHALKRNDNLHGIVKGYKVYKFNGGKEDDEE